MCNLIRVQVVGYRHIRMFFFVWYFTKMIIILDLAIDATCFFLLNFEKYFLEYKIKILLWNVLFETYNYVF